MCHKGFACCWVGNTTLYFGVPSSYDASSIMTYMKFWVWGSLLCHYWYITTSAGIYPRSTKDHEHSERNRKIFASFWSSTVQLNQKKKGSAHQPTQKMKRSNDLMHFNSVEWLIISDSFSPFFEGVFPVLRWFPFFQVGFPFFGAVSGLF